jgi:hypothetical protein
MNEQLARARLFLVEAMQTAEPEDRLRRCMAAVYFARSCIELMLEAAADKREIGLQRNDLEDLIAAELPFYEAVEALRIHDFHRFGIQYRPNAVIMLGPIKLRARGGSAALFIADNGPGQATSGDSQIIHQRSLTLVGDSLWLQGEPSPTPIIEIVDAFTTALPEALAAYDRMAALNG